MLKNKNKSAQELEKQYKILTKAELLTLNKRTVLQWFKECLQYVLKDEDYERAAQLRNAQVRYENQLLSVRK